MNKIVLESEFKSIGTDIYIEIIMDDIEDEKKASEDIERVKKIYAEKQKLLSRFNAKSELSILNNSLGEFHECSNDLLYLSKKSNDYFKETGGLFDPRILGKLERLGYRDDFKKNNFLEVNVSVDKNGKSGDLSEDLRIDEQRVMFKKKMDFSGIAKGYITDKVANFLKNEGWKNFLVDSGGDMFALGQNRKGKSWKIDIEGAGDKIVINIENEGLATSGVTRRKWKTKDGRRFHHIINPKHPEKFYFDIKSVSVIDKNTERADVLAKALFLMGAEKGINFSNENNIKSAFLLRNNNIIFSNELNQINER